MPGATIDAAHFEIALEPHLRKDRGDVIRPVGHRGALARQGLKSSLHQGAEGLTGDIDVPLAPLDEIHRYVEGVVHVSLEPHAGLERPRQHSGALGVGVTPDFRAEREKAVGLAFGERRIGEHRRRDRLQRKGDTQLLHHVGFRGIIDVRLHRARPIHHIESVFPHLRHVGRHNSIAPLRHHRNLIPAPVRCHAKS